KRGWNAIGTRGDESPHDWGAFLGEKRADLPLGLLASFLEQRNGTGVSGVGYQALAGIDPCGRDSANDECVGHDQTRQQLPERKEIIAAARCQFANCGQATNEVLQVDEVCLELGGKGGSTFLT